MPGIYKTPGVYVEEIPKFPPSIAPVETAIPAFIGYTEKAMQNGQNVFDKPIRIESIAEYESIFGGAPPQDVNIILDNNLNFVRADGKGKLFLYDSLRMFYANGGGKCYIISVGDYSATPAAVNIKDGIDKLEKEDEPTIILFPDAANLAIDDLCGVQVHALIQSAKLMDRVVLCDLNHGSDFKLNVQDFRDKIGINNLKYGAAYGPWLNVGLPRQIWHKNMKLYRNDLSHPVNLEDLTNDTSILPIIADLKLSEQANALLAPNPASKLDDDLLNAVQAVTNTTPATLANYDAKLQLFTDILENTLSIVWQIHELPVAANSIDQYITNVDLDTLIRNFAAHQKALTTLSFIDPDTPKFVDIALLLNYPDPTGTDTPGDALFTATTAATYPGGATDQEKAFAARDAANEACLAAIGLYNFVREAVSASEKSQNDALLSAFGRFKELSSKAAEALNLLPPSGAIAGVYAATDRERGVWKAPANVSLNAVIGPAVKISHEQQAEFNVDVNAGKSVNIIRSFTGKGTLVWGARTLAGNDNEWRYISVRRFFNFVEESVKKATEQFVFEPNDANTWVRVQAMIENFLNTLWRQGALQGIKPEHAFYVAVGLGKTMTPLDILEGRMIIEIGMAAVRPAEFIILRFSHKMAES